MFATAVMMMAVYMSCTATNATLQGRMLIMLLLLLLLLFVENSIQNFQTKGRRMEEAFKEIFNVTEKQMDWWMEEQGRMDEPASGEALKLTRVVKLLNLTLKTITSKASFPMNSRTCCVDHP